MNLRNYTSQRPVNSSLTRIEELLVQAGATHIAKHYSDEKELRGIIFQIPVNGVPMTFKLPADPEAVQKLEAAKIKRPRRGTLDRVREQAARTAWSLLADWVHVQVSMIAMGQAQAIQVFLPYFYDTQRDQTLFERMESTGFRQLTSGRGTEA